MTSFIPHRPVDEPVARLSVGDHTQRPGCPRRLLLVTSNANLDIERACGHRLMWLPEVKDMHSPLEPKNIEAAMRRASRGLRGLLQVLGLELGDLGQMVFLELSKKEEQLPRLESSEKAVRYVVTVAWHVLLELQRGRQDPVGEASSLVTEMNSLRDDCTDPSRRAESGEVLEILRDMIDRLPERQGGVLIQKYLERATPEEISRHHGVQKAEVYRRTHRALGRLKTLLRGRIGDLR